ncbi:MAG: hypothetical protein IH898_09390, partial [Planctomycetes bacterium]|nr:hypothetical protein [Planctomycetota bacterium]
MGDKSFGAVGDFNNSTVKLQGVLDPAETTFVQLKNLQGDDLSFTANDLEAIAPACYGYKPVAGT